MYETVTMVAAKARPRYIHFSPPPGEGRIQLLLIAIRAYAAGTDVAHVARSMYGTPTKILESHCEVGTLGVAAGWRDFNRENLMD